MLEMDSLEKQNQANLIFYYEKELKKILNGAYIHDIFSLSESRHLRNNGILEYRHPDWFVSKKTKEFLNKWKIENQVNSL